MLNKYELHTQGVVERKASRDCSQWLKQRAAMRAARQREIQLTLVRNSQIREQETGSASLVQKLLSTKNRAV